MKNRNRILALLLSVMMVFTYMPAIAFAEGEEPADPDTSAAEQVEEPAETNDEEPLVEKEADTDTAATETVEEAVANDDEAPSEEPEDKEPVSASGDVEKTAEITAKVADSDDLLMDYLEAGVKSKTSAPRLRKSKERTMGSYLSDAQQATYNYMAERIRAITDGTADNYSTVFTATAEEIGFDPMSVNIYLPEEDIWDEGDNLSDEATDVIWNEVYGGVLDALLADMPYYLYWFDKTSDTSFEIGGDFELSYEALEEGEGWVASLENATFTMSLPVAEAYQDGSAYVVKETKIEAANAAKETVRDIISDHSEESDINKLTSYKDEICERTSYNSVAANNTATPYGDPWQMIYVFDGNPNTTVVCEGYSKAFQFLCDNTESFESSGINCYSVTGTMSVGTGADDHMWNILGMDDGYYYIADITNSDDGTIGEDGSLFLKGYASKEEDEYRDKFSYDCKDSTVKYAYDDSTAIMYYNGELDMCPRDYRIVKSIKFEGQTIRLQENDDEFGEWVGEDDERFFKYDYPYWPNFNNDDTLTVTYEGIADPVTYVYVGYNPNLGEMEFIRKDGDDWDITDKIESDLLKCDSDQSAANPWTLGNTYSFTLSYCGCTTECPVKIIPNENTVIWDDSGFGYCLVESGGMNVAKIVGYNGSVTNSTLTIPEGLGDCEAMSFAIDPEDPVEGDNTDYSTISSIVLPEKVMYIRGWCIRSFSGLESVSIGDGENDFFKTVNGVLYRKIYEDEDLFENYKGLEVICYPPAKTGSDFTVPAGVISIGKGAFSGNKNIESIVLSPEITNVHGYAFASNNSKAENLKTITFTSQTVPEDADSFQGVRKAAIELGTEIKYPEDVVGFSEFVAELCRQGFAEIPEDVEVLENGSDKEYTSESADKVYTYSFTPEDDENYCVSITRYEPYDESSTLSAVIFRKGDSYEEKESTDYDSVLFSIEEYGNQTNYIQVRPGAACKFSVTVRKYSSSDFEDIPDTCETIVVGEERTVDILKIFDVVTYEFTPEVDGEYVFESHGEIDAVGRVIDSDGVEIVRDDDGGTEYNFSASFSAEAGKTYYLQARAYGDARGTFTVALKQDTIVEHTHTPGEAVTENEVAATCSEDGSYDEVIYCTECNEELSRETITVPALGHNYGAWQKYDEDQHERVCENDPTHIEYDSHSWNDGEVTKEATETEDGVMTFTCTVCGATREETIPAHGTDPAVQAAEQAKAAAQKAAAASAAAREAALAAEPGTQEAIDAANAYKDAAEAFVQAAQNAAEKAKAAYGEGSNEYEAALKVVAAAQAEAEDAEELAASAHVHVWDDGVVTSAATCYSEGVKTFTCTVCGANRTETIAKTAHTVEIIPAVPATCTETGLTEGKRCSVCGEETVPQTTISALGHQWDEGVVIEEPTATEEGVMEYTCERCGETRTESIPAIDDPDEPSVTSLRFEPAKDFDFNATEGDDWLSFYYPGNKFVVGYSDGSTKEFISVAYQGIDDGETVDLEDYFESGDTNKERGYFGYEINGSDEGVFRAGNNTVRFIMDDVYTDPITVKAAPKATALKFTPASGFVAESMEGRRWFDYYYVDNTFEVTFSDGSKKTFVCKNHPAIDDDGNEYYESEYFENGDTSKEAVWFDYEINGDYENGVFETGSNTVRFRYGDAYSEAITVTASPAPVALEFVPASGTTLWGVEGNTYIDGNSYYAEGNKFIVTYSDGSNKTFELAEAEYEENGETYWFVGFFEDGKVTKKANGDFNDMYFDYDIPESGLVVGNNAVRFGVWGADDDIWTTNTYNVVGKKRPVSVSFTPTVLNAVIGSDWCDIGWFENNSQVVITYKDGSTKTFKPAETTTSDGYTYLSFKNGDEELDWGWEVDDDPDADLKPGANKVNFILYAGIDPELKAPVTINAVNESSELDEVETENEAAAQEAEKAAAAAAEAAVNEGAIAAAETATAAAEAAADKALEKAEETAAKIEADPNATAEEKAAAQQAVQTAKTVKASASKASASVKKTAANAAATKAATAKTTADTASAKAATAKTAADTAATKAADAKKVADAAEAGTAEAVTAAKAYEAAANDASAKAQTAADEAQAAADKAKAAAEAAATASEEADKAVDAAEKAEAAAKAAYGENSNEYKAAQNVTKAATDAAATAKTNAANTKTAADTAAADAKAKKDAATAAAKAATNAAAATKAAVMAAKTAADTATTKAAEAKRTADTAATKAATAKTTADTASAKAATAKTAADTAAAKAAEAKKTADSAKAGTADAVTAAKAYEAAANDASAKAKAAADEAQAAADKAKAAAEAAATASKEADKAVDAAEKAEAAAKAAYGENSSEYKAAQSVTKAAKDAAATAKTNAASTKKAADTAASEAKTKKDAATAAATAATNAAAATKAATAAKDKADHTGTPEISLSSTSFSYAYKVQKVKVGKKKKTLAVGTIQKPSVTTVRLNGNVLKAGTDYDVSYSNEESANIGTYIVTVTLKGAYSGKGTATYTINPKGVNLKKAAKGKKSFTASWKKLSKNDIKYKVIGGYQLRYSTDPTFPDASTKVIKAGTIKTAKKAVKKLQAKTTYYVQLRTYKAVSGVTYYSNWSPTKAVKTK